MTLQVVLCVAGLCVLSSSVAYCAYVDGFDRETSRELNGVELVRRFHPIAGGHACGAPVGDHWLGGRLTGRA